MSLEWWPDLVHRFERWTGVCLSEAMHGGGVRACRRMADEEGLTPSRLLRRAADDERVRQRLINRLTVGTTWFLRERAALSELVGQLVDAGGPGRRVAIWSAGCSTGEEAYSLSILAKLAGLKPRILATDVSTKSLRRGIEARYPEDVLATLPKLWANEYFEEPTDGLVRVCDEVRQAVVFERHNLALDEEPPHGWRRFDAVVCRNVLMYFPKDRAVGIVRRLVRACRGGGFLLLGPTERPLFWPEIERRTGEQSPVIEVDAKRRIRRRRPTRHPVHVQAEPPTPELGGEALKRELEACSRMEKTGRRDDSLARLSTIAHEHPNNAAVHLEWGLQLKRAGHTRKAVHELRVAATLDPVGWLVEYQLGMCLATLGEAAEARRCWAQALRRIESGARPGHVLEQEDLRSMARTVAKLCRSRLEKKP